jgi:hypothetical protein
VLSCVFYLLFAIVWAGLLVGTSSGY